MSGELLLLSSTRVHGQPYLAHAYDALRAFLDGIDEIYFVPWALADHDGYVRRAGESIAPIGKRFIGVHTFADPRAALARAKAVCVGGGNSFRLLDALYRHDVLDVIRARVRSGELRYVGTSAGTNVAAPTIKTTNDMPIVEPPSLVALGLAPFQINPHYLDADPSSTHMGETRAERLAQYLEENDRPVVALYDGSWLRGTDGAITLDGPAGGMLFARGAAPARLEPGTDLSRL